MTGLYDDDLAAVLRGRTLTEVVAPLAGEEAAAYAKCAVSRFLVLNVTRWPGGPNG